MPTKQMTDAEIRRMNQAARDEWEASAPERVDAAVRDAVIKLLSGSNRETVNAVTHWIDYDCQVEYATPPPKRIKTQAEIAKNEQLEKRARERAKFLPMITKEVAGLKKPLTEDDFAKRFANLISPQDISTAFDVYCGTVSGDLELNDNGKWVKVRD